MAQKKVVNPNRPFYEAVQKAIRALHHEYPLYLAMLFHFEDRPPNEWTLLVGADGLVLDRYKGMKVVTTTLSGSLSDEYGRRIKKIGIVDKNDPFFQSFRRLLSLKPIGLVEIERISLNGIEIEKGAVFAVQGNGG